MKCNLCGEINNQERNYVVYMHVSPNNKKYIGITGRDNVIDRWDNGKGYKNNRYFSNAINKYGWDNFKHIILFEDLTFEEANMLEMFYISYYDTYNNPSKGYNQTKGGQGVKGRIVTREQKKYMRKKSENISRKVINVTTGEIYNSLNSAGRNIIDHTKSNRLETITSKLRDCCRGKLKTAYGYEWWYLNEYENNLEKGSTSYVREDLTLTKRIINISTNEVFDNAKVASDKYNINKFNIIRCCKGEVKKCNKHKWMFKEDYDKAIENGSFISDKTDGMNKSKKIKVYERVVCLNTMEEFEDMYSAANHYNINPYGINKCCLHKQTYSGIIDGEKYIWMFKKDYIKLTKDEINNIKSKVNYVKPKKKHIQKEKKYSVVCTTTMEKFYNMKEPAIKYNTQPASIQKCCAYIKGDNVNRIMKHAGKLEDGTELTWQYYDDYLKNGIKFPDESNKWKNNPNKRSVICLDTGYTYESISQASDATGINIKTIHSCLKGRQKTACGLRWSYLEDIS